MLVMPVASDDVQGSYGFFNRFMVCLSLELNCTQLDGCVPKDDKVSSLFDPESEMLVCKLSAEIVHNIINA